MKQIAFVFAAAVMAAAQGQNTSVDQRAKQVIDAAIAALGGEKFLDMRDRVETGRAYSFYNEQLSGLSITRIYTRYLTVPPNKSGEELGVLERQSFGKNEDSAVVLREDRGTNITFRGPKPIPAEEFERYRDTTLRNIFYIFRQRLNEPGLIFEFRGTDIVDREPVNIVDVTDSQDRVVRVYFHQSTKLPVKQEFSWRDPKTRDRNEEATHFARYQSSPPGIQWPHQITRERNGERIFQIFADSVAFNQTLTDDLFSPEVLRPKK